MLRELRLLMACLVLVVAVPPSVRSVESAPAVEVVYAAFRASASGATQRLLPERDAPMRTRGSQAAPTVFGAPPRRLAAASAPELHEQPLYLVHCALRC